MAFFWPSNHALNPFLAGAPPRRLEPRWGSVRRSPDPLVGWGYSLPTPFPSTPSSLDLAGLSAYGVSILLLASLHCVAEERHCVHTDYRTADRGNY